MSKTKPLGLILPDWRIRAIGEGRCRRFTVPIEDAPESHVRECRMGDALNGELFGVWFVCRDGRLGPNGTPITSPHNYSRFIECPYQPGDVLYVKERWCKGNDEYGSPVIGYSDKTARYWGLDHRGDVLLGECESDWSGDALDGKWRPADTLPEWAARYRLRITAVSAYRVREIKPEDAIREGIGQVGEWEEPAEDFTACWESYGQPEPYFNSPVDSFHAAWSQSYPAYPFDTAWGFGCEFELEAK